jgi:hypothetical protein
MISRFLQTKYLITFGCKIVPYLHAKFIIIDGTNSQMEMMWNATTKCIQCSNQVLDYTMFYLFFGSLQNWPMLTHHQLLEGLKEESQAKDSGKRKGIGACSLTRSTRGVEGHAGAPGLGLGRVTSLIHLLEPASKPTTKWLVHIPEHLGARTSHRQHGFTWLTTARTRGKPPPSPI